MKKIIICLLALFLISGCSKNREEAEEGKVTLKIWETYNEKEHNVFLEVIKDFKKYYKANLKGKYKVKLDIVASRIPFGNAVESIKTACSINATPDIGRIDAGKVLELAYHQILVPLDTIEDINIEEKGKAYLPAPFKANVIKVREKGKWVDHLYGFPEQATCVALYYNKGMFKEKSEELAKAGLDSSRAPRTWKEAIEYAKILTDPAKKQFGFGFRNNLWFTFPFFSMYQAKFISIDPETGKQYCSINSKLGVAALQKKIDMCLKEYDVKGGKSKIEAGAWKGGVGPDQGFINGSYAMVLSGPWHLKTFSDSVKDLGVALIPKISKEEAIKVGLITENATDEEYNAKITTSTNLGGNSLVMFKTCKGIKRKIAYDFMNFVTSKKAQLKWAKELDQIPINMEAFKEVKSKKDMAANKKVFIEQIYYANAQPKVPLSSILYEFANLEMENALKQRKTAKEALDTVADQINKKIFTLVNEAVIYTDEDATWKIIGMVASILAFFTVLGLLAKKFA